MPNLTTGPVGDTFNIDLPIYVTNEEATLQLKKAWLRQQGLVHQGLQRRGPLPVGFRLLPEANLCVK